MRSRRITALFLLLAAPLMAMLPLTRLLSGESSVAAANTSIPALVPVSTAPGGAPALPVPNIDLSTGPVDIISYTGSAPASAGNATAALGGSAPAAPAALGLPAAIAGAPAGANASGGNASGRSYSDQGTTAAPARSSSAMTTASSDTEAPQIFNVKPPDGAFTGSSVVFSADYSDPAPSSGIDPESAMIHLDNKMLYDGCAASETHVSCPKSGLSEGAHKLEIFVCDMAGNCSQTNGSFQVDTAAPAITDTKPSGTINNSSATISAVFDDAAGAGIDTASVQLTLDAKDITPSCAVTAGGARCDVSGLDEGNHDITIQAKDKAGNQASNSWTFRVDFTAIGITDHLPAASSWQKSPKPAIGASFQKTSQGSINADSIRVYVDDTDVTAQTERDQNGVSYTPANPLDDGPHNVRVTVSDDANHGGDSEWSFFVDTVPPDVSGESPTGSTTTTPKIGARYADDGSGINPSSVKLMVDGVDKTAGSDMAEGGVSYTPIPPEMPLSPGVHSAQISVTDVAGNRTTAAWSFTVTGSQVGAPPVISPTTAVERLIAVPVYWQGYAALASTAGSWRIAGLTSWPNTYILPWYNPNPSSSAHKSELLIVNQGAGEAFVSIFVGGQEKWHGNIPEGGREARELPETIGGPVKVICPTGQALAISHQVSGPGFESETVAVPLEELEPVSVLPWYDPSPAGGAGSSRLVIANAGDTESQVDLYQGDPASPDSLKGHYSIKPDSAAIAKLPDAGGPVKVVSTNNQPLVVSQRVFFNGSFAEILAPGLSRLAPAYLLPEAKEQSRGNEIVSSRILVGNPAGQEAMVKIRSGENFISDPDNPGNDYFLIPGGSSRSIALDEIAEEPLEVTCLNCGLFDGLTVGRETVRNNSITCVMGTPQPLALP